MNTLPILRRFSRQSFVLLLAGGIGCFAWSTLWGKAPPAAAPQTPALRQAAGLFRHRCARCHGSDGTGRSGSMPGVPDFTSPLWHRARSNTQLTAAILDGAGSRMPSFAGVVNHRQATKLVAFIRTLNPAQGGRTADSPDEFARRFFKLQRELAELQREYRKLQRRPARASR
jgi:mono/diheme cytochrome c family protein